MNRKPLWTTCYGNNAPMVSLRGREYAITVREEVDTPTGRETRYRATRPGGKTEVFLCPEDIGTGQPYSLVTPKRKLPPEIRGDIAATS